MTYKPFTGTGTDFYVASDDAAEMVNLAIALERPILVEGEAGCGKTLLARAIATELGLGAPISISVKSTSRAKDLLYRFDALRRLQDSQGGDRLSRFQFWGTVADQIGIELTRDALWAALEDGVTEPTGDLSASAGELLLPRPAIRPSVSLRGSPRPSPRKDGGVKLPHKARQYT